MRNDIRIYGDETIFFSFLVEDGPDEDNLVPIDISTAAIAAYVKCAGVLVTTFDTIVRDQAVAENLGHIDLSLSAAKVAILRDHKEDVFTYDVRLTLAGETWHPIEGSEITHFNGVTTGA